MEAVTLSPKFQVVIPRAVRENLHLKPGQKFEVLEFQGRIELIPQRRIADLRGFVRGIDTRFDREPDRV